MRTLWMVAFAATLVACNNGISEETDGDTDTDTDTDTDSDTDTDTDTDSDTDTDTDTEDTRPEGKTLSFLVAPDPGGMGVSLLQIDPEAERFGDDLAGAPVARGSASLELGPAPEEHLALITDIGVEAAVYVPYVFEDKNGNGQKDADEFVVGGGESFVVWMEAVSGPLVLLGFQPGWNAVTGDFEPISTTDIPLPANLLPNLSVTGGGSVGSPIDKRRLTLVEPSSLEGGGAPLFLLDQPLTDPFTFTAEGPPPPEHAVGSELEGAALELPVVYRDDDDSGGYTEGDTSPTALCSEGETIALAWLPQPLTVEAASFYFDADAALTPGWSGFLVKDLEAEALTPLTADAMAKLVIGGCDFPE